MQKQQPGNIQSKQKQVLNKQKLKQQAKSLLLKGCYKMAMNKYIGLLKLSSQGFTQRQWSVINLNLAITYQFMGKLQQAIQQVDKAIQIDPLYEKAYYRKIQILAQKGQQQKAFSLNIPHFINNKQIQDLKTNIKQDYKNSMGFDILIKKVQQQNQLYDKKQKQQHQQNMITIKAQQQSIHSIHSNLIQQIHENLYNKMCNQFSVQNQCDLKQLSNILHQQSVKTDYEQILNISSLISKYYIQLCNLTEKNPFKQKYLKSFLLFIQKLAYNLNFKGISILLTFWNTFLIRRYKHNSIKLKSLTIQDDLIYLCPSILFDSQLFILNFKQIISNCIDDKLQAKQSIKLRKFLHINSLFVPYRLVLSKIHTKDELFCNSNKLISIQSLDTFIDLFTQKLENQIYKANNLKVQQRIQLINSTIKLLLQSYPNYKKQFLSNLQIQTLGDLFKFSFIINSKFQQCYKDKTNDKNNKEIYEPQQNTTNRYIQLCQESLKQDKFVNILILQKMIGIFKKEKTKQLIIPLKQILEKLINQDPEKSKLSLLKKTVYTNMLLKIDIKQSIMIKQKQQSQNNKSKQKVSSTQNSLINLLQKIIKNKKFEKERFDMLDLFQAQHILLLCLNDLGNILKVLKYQFKNLKLFIQIILRNTSYLKNEQLSEQKSNKNTKKKENLPKVQILQLISNFLYVLVVDTQKQTEKVIAEKMGVSSQEIQKARKLQGQLRNENVIKQLTSLRRQFGTFLVKQKDKQGQNMFIQLCTFYNIIKTHCIKQLQDSTIKTVKVFKVLSQYQSSRFYHNAILSFMVQPSLILTQIDKQKNKNDYSFKFSQKYLKDLSKFFPTILKKCNPQILPYPLIQNMVKILQWSINNSDHQLTIFQSYLSLIGLSSLNGVKISLQKITHGLYEQNQYIVHGTLQLMNNILLTDGPNGCNLVNQYYQYFNNSITNKGSNKSIQSLKTLINIVIKYIDHYRQLILKDNPILKSQPITDYSHGYKIFGTLISLSMVLKLQNKVEQLNNWQKAIQMINKMYRKGQKIKNKDVSICMFKLIIHHYNFENGKSLRQYILKNNDKKWYESQMIVELMSVLEAIDKEKWMKLKQLLK